MVTKEKLLEQLEEWMDWLETPNENFGGYPVCPFLAPERKTNQLLIEFYNPDVLIVGGDWRHGDVVGREHAKEVRFFNRVGGYSSTDTINKITNKYSN